MFGLEPASPDAMELRRMYVAPTARHAGYRMVREVVAEQISNKTVGGGVRRYHFEKCMQTVATLRGALAAPPCTSLRP